MLSVASGKKFFGLVVAVTIYFSLFTIHCLYADTYDYLASKVSKVAKNLTNKKIAILPFQYYDGRKSPGSTIVAERLTTKIVEQGKLQVVERTLLNKIMDELKLGQSGIVDQESTKELGKVLGVEAIVTGTLIEEVENSAKVKEVDINARLIKVETGDILVAANKKIKKTWEDVIEEKPQQIPSQQVEHEIPSEPEIIKIGPRAEQVEVNEMEDEPSFPVSPQIKQNYRSLVEGRYKDTLNEAKNIFRDNQDKPFIASHALFIIGRASESEGDMRGARDAYLRIIKDYPFNKNIVQRAQRRLRHINRVRGRE